MAPPTSPVRVALAVTCLVVTTGFLAQGVPTLPLGAPNARLNAEFTRVSAVRELDDGRVLIVDEADKRVAVGDWKTGTVRQIGRVGSGPGEYQLPQRLLALSADSTLLTDVMAGRWLLFAGDSIVETIPASAPPIAAGARFLILDQPTAGVDIGAKADIYEQVDRLARDGVGILLISDELDELLNLCDRIAVLTRGRLGTVSPAASYDRPRLLQAITAGAGRR